MDAIRQDLEKLARNLIEKCRKHQLKIVLAESMTGGLLVSELTAIENASEVIDQSYIVYSEKAKKEILKCKQETMDTYSVYSKELIKEMISGLGLVSDANIKIAISGIAGPKTYFDLVIGTVFIGIEINGKEKTYKKVFNGNRKRVRYQTAKFVFNEIIQLIQ